MGNITQVHFKDGQECCYNITGLEQWDKGQKLEISGLDVEECAEVHFSLQQYCGTAKRMLGKMVNGILHTYIPAFVMEGPEYICAGARTYSAYAWIYVSDEESAETIRKMEFVIKARPKPAEYVTPEDLGFLEQLEAEMKKKLDKSGHAPNKILATDAEGNVIAKDAEAEVDLTDYVKNTDYANKDTGGVVKVFPTTHGLNVTNGILTVLGATKKDIDERISGYKPIVPYTLDYAVMKSLSDSKYDWTEEEKSNSRNLLGATGEDQLLQFAIKPTTEKDTFLNIQDSADYKVLDIGMEGKTEQDTMSGNNLLEPNVEHWEMQKSLSWGAMAGTKVNASNRLYSAFTILDVKPSSLMSFLNDTTNKYWVDRIIEADENGLGYVNHRLYDDASTQNKKNYSFTTNENTTRLYVQVRLLDDTKTFTETDLGEMKILVGYGNITSYEPYTGGQPSPNPGYPQEVVNAGEIYNLLNPGELENGLLLDENGSISTAGTYGDVYRIFKQTLPAGTYTLFINGAKISITRMILDGNFNVLNTTASSSYTFTVAKKSEVTICFRKEDSSAFDGTEEIQLNVGANAKPYKPYTGRYEIGERVVNKNFYSGGDVIGTQTSIVNIEAIPAGTYKFGANAKSSDTDNDKCLIGFYYAGESDSLRYSLSRGNKESITVTFEKDINRIMFYAAQSYENGKDDAFSFTDIQIEQGTVATNYTPHQSQNITLTSPVPLTKWDKLVKRDGVYGWSIQGKHTLANATSEEFYYGWTLHGEKNGVYVWRTTNLNKSIGWQTSLCTTFKNVNAAYNDYVLWTYSDQPALKNMYFCTNFSTVEEWMAYINENPLDIWYKADEEQAFYPLPDSEQELLHNLETYYGVTNVFNDQGCPMWLTYVADTKLYIDNKILSIQTAMI